MQKSLRLLCLCTLLVLATFTFPTLSIRTIQAGSPLPATRQNPFEHEFSFDFSDGRQGWTAGFADSTTDVINREKVVFKLKKLPKNLGERRKVLFIGGTNQTDDLFMFIKRQLTGLRPDTIYSLQFDVQIASNAPTGCVGAGGAPGDSVYFKVGASPIEPVADPQTTLLNIDKGNQSQGGKDVITIGTIATTGPNCDLSTYEFKTLGTDGAKFQAKTDASGNIWVLLGTDSAFESRTELFYSKIKILLNEATDGQ